MVDESRATVPTCLPDFAMEVRAVFGSVCVHHVVQYTIRGGRVAIPKIMTRVQTSRCVNRGGKENRYVFGVIVAFCH